MATVNLGSIKFNWKGTYNGSTAYAIDDVVEYNGSSYIAIQAGTGNLPTNTAYFEQMSSAGTNGTNGTDLGTTLTTQGDIVYRDGSGLARLGAGTSGQVLQTNGTGANPSWGTVSSDYVKIATFTQTTAVNSVSIDGYFTSDYDIYYLEFHGAGESSSNKIRVYANESGTKQTTTNIKYISSYADLQESTNTATNSYTNSNNDSNFRLGWFDSGQQGGAGTLRIFNPLSTNRYKFFTYNTASYANDYHYALNGQAQRRNNNAISGITLEGNSSSNTIKFDRATLYGLKH